MTQNQLIAHSAYVTDVSMDEIELRNIQSAEEWNTWCAEHATQLEADADELIADEEFVKTIIADIKFEDAARPHIPRAERL